MAEGRNPDGTFTKGHKHSQGEHKTSSRALLEELRRAYVVDGEVVGDEFKSVVNKLQSIAMNDERKDQIKAIEILLAYLLGKPRQSIELEGDERIVKLYDVAMSAAMGKA